MPDTSPTDEKQVKRILKRWRNYTFRCSLLFTSALLIIFFILPLLNKKIILGIADITLLIVTILMSPIIYQWATKRFACRLSPDERNLLKQAAISPASQPRGVCMLLEAIAPDKELLRPSQQTQDKTLLRAAAYTDNAPQDQLLRPTTQEPNDPTP